MKRFQTFLNEANKLPEEASQWLQDLIYQSIEWHKGNMYSILDNIDEAYSKEAEKVMEKEWSKHKDEYDDAVAFGFATMDGSEDIKWPPVTKYVKQAMKKETPLIPYFCVDPTENIGPKVLRDDGGYGGGGYGSFGDTQLIEENGTLVEAKMPIELFYDAYMEDGNFSTYAEGGDQKSAVAVALWLDPKSRVDKKFADEVIKNLVERGMDDKSAKAVVDKPMQMAKDVFAELKTMF